MTPTDSKKKSFNIKLWIDSKFIQIVDEAKKIDPDYSMTDLYHEIFEHYLELREQANGKIADILAQSDKIESIKKHSFAVGFLSGVALVSLSFILKNLMS